MLFEIGAIITDFLTLALGIFLCYMAIAGRRASAGLTPKSRPLPLLPVKVLVMLVGVYTIGWSFIQIGLDFGFVGRNSKIFLLTEAFNNHTGRAFVEILLIIWFILFGFSMARLLFAPGKVPATRIFATLGFVVSIAVIVSNCYLLCKLIRGI